jgi:hypothetical protein
LIISLLIIKILDKLAGGKEKGKGESEEKAESEEEKAEE